MLEMYAKVQKLTEEGWFIELYENLLLRSRVPGILAGSYGDFTVKFDLYEESVRAQIILDNGYVLNEETLPGLKEALVHIIYIVDTLNEKCCSLPKGKI